MADSRRRRALSASTSNPLDFSYYMDTEPQNRNPSIPKIISSPEMVFKVIRSFDERKKDIVRSIGFGGLLQLSRFTDLDPYFSLWLYRNVRWNTFSFHLGDKFNFVIRPDHIGKIMGIPYSGIEVCEKSSEIDEQNSAFMKMSLSFLGSEPGILDSAEAYLQTALPFGFTQDESNKFKVAFVIFVMGRLLAPSSDKCNPRSDFWGALKNPDAIHSFNWSAFVLSDLMDASCSIVWDTLRNKKISVILGCPLILQILYLDIIELGALKLPHDVLPRVKHFNSSLLKRMIEADSLPQQSSTALPSYGISKSMRTDNICYDMRANASKMRTASDVSETAKVTSPVTHPVKMNSDKEHNINHARCKDPVIQNNSPFSTPRRLPMQKNNDSDAPDFSSVMRDYFQGKVDASLLECFRFHQAMCLHHFSKYTNALKAAITKENITLVSKVVNHQRQCAGLEPINLEFTRPSVTRRTYDDMLSGAESGDDITPGPNRTKFSSRLRSVHTPTVKKDKSIHSSSNNSALVSPNQTSNYEGENMDHSNFSTPLYCNPKTSVMFEMPTVSPTTENVLFCGANLGVRMISAAQGADLNERSLDAEYSVSPLPKKDVQPGRLAVTHWARSIDHPIRDAALTKSFYHWLAATTSDDLKNAWIIHDTPRFIQVSGKQLKDQFTHIQPLLYDVFDLCIRRFRQLDKAICPKGVHLRWRHLLESDFSMHVLGGENPTNSVSIRQQFASNFVDYDLERCRMFFAPVFVEGLWWCYAWDFKSLTLTINDPSVGHEKDALVIQKHSGTIQLLNKFLTESILEYYTGWTPKFHDCNIVVFRTPDMPIERSYSGFFSLFFIKNFNGTNLVTNTSMTALQSFKEYMVYELLELNDNRGRPPSGYIHSIDD